MSQTKTLTDKLTSKDIWTPNLDITLPIHGSDISNFREWINWNGYSPNHIAYDFAAYLTRDGKCVLGLPKEIPIRAITDGVIKQVSQGFAGSGVPYATFINIEHGKNESGMFSNYHHVDSLVESGQEVKKGDIVATLHKDKGYEKGKLVHLHFELTHGRGVRNRKCNPESIYTSIGKYRAEPQGSQNFQILGLQEQPEIHIANFKKLLVNDK